VSTVRRAVSTVAAEARYAMTLRVLPARVAWFDLRARALARRIGDGFSLASATRAADVATLLELANGRRHVVELGTGSGWTSIALAIADPARTVVTYDVQDRAERDRYLSLAGGNVRHRIAFINAPGATGPRAGAQKVELLYIDSSHDRQETIDELNAWSAVLIPGAPVVFDDYTHPDYPGVHEAIAELGLTGEARGTLFVHHAR
jgi:predicted O-methyltransferase YrrM